MRKRYPAQLSGGQRQRVGVARALAVDPPLMLMDEPFGAIDPITRSRLQDEFLRLQTEIRKTVLFVTHDIDEAIKMGDRIAVLRTGGELAQFATPAELLMHPADEFVEQFVGADRALKRLALTRVRELDLRVLMPEQSATASRASPRTSRCATRSPQLLQAGRQEGIVVDGSGQRARRDLDRPDLAIAGAAGVNLIVAQTVIPDFGGGENSCVRQNRGFCWNWVQDNWSDVLWPAVRQHVALTAIAVVDRLRRSPSRWRCSRTGAAASRRRPR